MQFSAPSRLQFVSQDMYEQAIANFHADIEDFRQNSVSLLREKFKGLVDHIIERLTPDEDGQRKIFRKSMVENLKEFVYNFQHLNITNDMELAEEINKVNLLMEGIEPSQLRSGQALPQQITSVLGRVQASVDGMIERAPKRRVRYEVSNAQDGAAA